MPAPARRLYIQRLLCLYRLAPGTSGHLRRTDRQLAGELHDRGVSLETVHAALILAVARRTFRSPHAPALPLIATLHYFRPVIDEILTQPPAPAYHRYIRRKLTAVAPELVAAGDHRIT